jgi:hypothetical protein
VPQQHWCCSTCNEITKHNLKGKEKKKGRSAWKRGTAHFHGGEGARNIGKVITGGEWNTRQHKDWRQQHTHTHKEKKNAAAENEETSKADTAVSSCPFFLPASSYIQNAFNYTTDQRRKKKDRSLEQQQGKKEYQRKRRVEAAHNTLKDVTAKRYV